MNKQTTLDLLHKIHAECRITPEEFLILVDGLIEDKPEYKVKENETIFDTCEVPFKPECNCKSDLSGLHTLGCKVFKPECKHEYENMMYEGKHCTRCEPPQPKIKELEDVWNDYQPGGSGWEAPNRDVLMSKINELIRDRNATS